MKSAQSVLMIALPVIMLFICGCKKNHSNFKEESKVSGIQTNFENNGECSSKITWDSLAATNVLVSFKGRVITKGDFDNHVALMSALIKNRYRKITAERLQMNIQKALPQVMDELVSRLLLSEGLALTNGASEVAQTSEKIKLEYEKRFCHKGQTFADLVHELSNSGCDSLFLSRFNQDAQFQTAINTTYSNQLVVTAAEYTNSVEHIEWYNRVAMATNALNWAVASNVLKRIEAGEDFAKLADRYSQDPDKESGGDLGECDISTLRFGSSSEEEFSKTPYWKALSGLYDGQHTGILETDVGLEIIKRYSYIAPSNSNTGLPAMHLARIYFRKPYIYPKQSESELRLDLAAEKREIFLKAISDSVQKSARLEFPLGVDIFPKSHNNADKRTRLTTRKK